MTPDPAALPADLPVPVDDGAADHLRGHPVPDLPVRSTSGEVVDLSAESRLGRVVIFAYPRTGRSGQQAPSGWDDIPGARGCTPQACSFRDLADEFAALGTTVYGLSTQDIGYQAEAAARLQLPYALLSDEQLALCAALRLPTFDVDGTTLLRRLTMVLVDGVVEHVHYPVFPPDRAAADTVALLRGGG